jgi:hypothetical protein
MALLFFFFIGPNRSHLPNSPALSTPWWDAFSEQEIPTPRFFFSIMDDLYYLKSLENL